jgi:hypothetical protein
VETKKKTFAMRAELANAVRHRYRMASRKEKGKILDEFIAVTGYHPKAAIRALNSVSRPSAPRTQRRRRVYDEAVQQALIVLWEASDRLCGKRLEAMLPNLIMALERRNRLQLNEAIRAQLLKMRSATIDRLLRAARQATKTKKVRSVQPDVRRRVRVRTFADWNEPPPGNMEMDLVAHCGEVNRGSYLYSLVLTDIASGWTECAPLVVREGGVLIEALERIRLGLPFALRALDVDNGSEFVNEMMIQCCLRNGIELTRSRPYRKNDQAWIEQKNGSVVRRHLGYRRFEGIAAAKALARLYGASRLFGNFFQPSFKLAEKHRQGAKVSKRYHPPQTPCERLLQAETIPEAVKAKLREVWEALDPLQLLEEVRAMQAHLVALSKGGTPAVVAQEPDLSAFLASLSGAWRAGEIRPTHGAEPTTRYLRQMTPVIAHEPLASDVVPPPQPKVVHLKTPRTPPVDRPLWRGLDPDIKRQSLLQQQEFARRRIRRQHAFTLVWPLVCRRLEGRPNLSATELFEELCLQYPGRFHRGQLRAFTDRVVRWRQDARARGMVIGRLTSRNNIKPRTRRRPDPFKAHWTEILQHLEADPDQTSFELLAKLMANYPAIYGMRHLRTLQRRVKLWRQEAVQKLICEMKHFTQDVGARSAG